MQKYIKKDGTVSIYNYERKNKFIHDRDKVCQICGKSEKLDVHHIDMKGPHLTSNSNESPDNLILLCHKCHIRLHFGILGKHKEIIKKRINGETYQSIANQYGLSRQRIFQIIKENT